MYINISKQNRNRIETYRITSAINLKPSDQIYSKMLKKTHQHKI